MSSKLCCQRRQKINFFEQENPIIKMNYNDFLNQFCFDEEVGSLIDFEKYKLVEKFKPWYEIVPKIGDLNMSNKTKVVLDQLELITTDELVEFREVLIAYCLVLQMSTSYIWFSDPPQKILPKQLAIPLYDLTQKLNINPVYSHISQFYNWEKIDKSKGYSFDNIKLRWSFSNSIDEDNFLVASHWPSIIYARLTKILFHIQKSIQNNDIKSYLKQMDEINTHLKEIAITVKKIWDKTRPFMFFKVYSKYLTGFTDKELFPNGVYFEGVDKYISCPGGSAGQDNGFQVFERAFGLNYIGNIQHMQSHIRQGVAAPWKGMIEFFEKYSKIRQFAIFHGGKCKQAYNLCIDSWSLFWQRHHSIIRVYVEDEAKKNGLNVKEIKSTGDVPLRVIKAKYDEVLKFYIN